MIFMKHLLFIFTLIAGLMLNLHTAIATDKMTDKIYNATSIILPNAMQVVVVENHRTPAVTHMVWYRIGGADEPIGESGLAHYLEHLMFKGTELVPSGALSKKVKSWGGNDNAFTSWDYTAYYQTVPKDKLQSVMRMEADRMRNLNFDDAEALTERAVVIEERKQRTGSNPSAQLSESMRAALFPNHPYARPIIGWDHEVEALSPLRAREFYKKYYAPKNAILVVSGDVIAEEVFEQAMIIYGKLENTGAETRPVWPLVADVYGNMLIEHADLSVQQPMWRRLHRVPGVGQNYKESLVFSIAEDILGKNTGRFYQNLVVENKIASAVSFYYSGSHQSDGILSIGVSPREGVDFATVEANVTKVLGDIASHGISQQEVQEAIDRLRDEAVYERDSITGPAMVIGYQLAAGLDLEQIENWANDIGQVTAEDVRAVVVKYLLPASDHYKAVTGHLVPKTRE